MAIVWPLPSPTIDAKMDIVDPVGRLQIGRAIADRTGHAVDFRENADCARRSFPRGSCSAAWNSIRFRCGPTAMTRRTSRFSRSEGARSRAAKSVGTGVCGDV